MAFVRPGTPGAAAKAASKPAAAPARKARYGGIKVKADQLPLLGPSVCLWECVSLEEGQIIEGKNQYNRLRIECVETIDGPYKPGAVVELLFCVSGKGRASGEGRMKDAIRAFAGYDNEADYDAWDPEGHGIDAALNLSAPEPYDQFTIVGSRAYCTATEGKEVIKDGVRTGERYTNCQWDPGPAVDGAA